MLSVHGCWEATLQRRSVLLGLGGLLTKAWLKLGEKKRVQHDKVVALVCFELPRGMPESVNENQCLFGVVGIGALRGCL